MNKDISIDFGGSLALGNVVRDFLLKNGWTDAPPTNVVDLAMQEGHRFLTAYKDKGQITHGPNGDARTKINASTEFGKLVEMISVPPIKIKLNAEYTAVVSPDRKTVTVGCQTFPAEKILEVAAALKS